MQFGGVLNQRWASLSSGYQKACGQKTKRTAPATVRKSKSVLEPDPEISDDFGHPRAGFGLAIDSASRTVTIT